MFLLLLLPCAVATASVPSATQEKKEVDVKKIIFDHVKDSYEWHITTIGDKHIAISLPIIVYSSRTGLSTFSSSVFHEQEEYNGFRIATTGKNEGKIVEVDADGNERRPMLDLSLTAAMLRAMKRGSRIIFIGDSDQLPSVGAGNVLSDLIGSERIRTIRLTEIFRQSKESLIITNAHRINEGTPPLINVTDSDFFFVRREREGDIADTIASLIDERLPKTYGTAIKEKIQVITPSKKGVAGVEAVNSVLQARLNPPAKFKREKESHGTVFREGDRVMQIVNNYDIEWEKNGATGIGLFNGDIGVI